MKNFGTVIDNFDATTKQYVDNKVPTDDHIKGIKVDNATSADTAKKVQNAFTYKVYNKAAGTVVPITYDGSEAASLDFSADDFAYDYSSGKNIKVKLVDKGYAKKQGGNTFTGDQTVTGNGSVSGNLTVGGNLTINGTTTTVDSTTLQVKDKLIEVAHGNTAALTTPAGLVAPKYDGTNSGALVFDSTGTAYVGDVTLKDGNIDVANSGLQPLATRTGLVDSNLPKWDGTAQTLADSGIPVAQVPRKDQENTWAHGQDITGATADGYSIKASGYVKGSWLQASAASNKGSGTGKVCVFDNNNWIYYRTPAEILAEAGGAKSTDIPTNYVTTDTAQAISGAKTFTNDVVVNKTTPKFNMKLSGLTNGTASSANQFGELCFLDKNGVYEGGIRFDSSTNGENRTKLSTNSFGTTHSNYVGLFAKQNATSATAVDIWRFIPNQDAVIDLGSSDLRWRNVHAVTTYSNVYGSDLCSTSSLRLKDPNIIRGTNQAANGGKQNYYRAININDKNNAKGVAVEWGYLCEKDSSGNTKNHTSEINLLAYPPNTTDGSGFTKLALGKKSDGSAYLRWDSHDVALKKDIPTVPTKTSELTNDSGFITSGGSVKSVIDYGDNSKKIKIGYAGTGLSGDSIKYIAGYTTGDDESYARIKDINKAAMKDWLGYATVATSGSYNDLSNQPTFSLSGTTLTITL